MTAKTPPELDALELSIRARRGELRPDEQHAFVQALDAAPGLRLLHELGRDLDTLTHVRSGDEALIERAVDRARAAGTVRPRPSRSRLGILLVAALFVASAAAAAHVVMSVRQTPPAPPAPPAAAAADARDTPGRAVAKAPSPSSAPPREHTPDPRASAPLRGAAPPRPTQAGPAAPSSAPAEATAATLFREAGAARRAGDLGTARSLYVELQSRFPDSSEARVSHVSLGKLYLSAGRARDAELEFAKYLRTGVPELREEALVGRADALSALGQDGAEREVWQELLRRYPASVYATRARKRLGTIDRLAAPTSP